ncbi:hypothetical protein D3C87_828030 [compost metagenome]
MDDVFQFANVARPTVATQFVLGTGADTDAAITQALAVGLDEMAREREDIAGTLTQRAQFQIDHVEAVIQILAEMAGIDGLLQLHVGRCQHPHIDGNAFARAQPHHFALLQHPQQLHLNRHRQIADLIEKQGAAVRFLEPSGLGAQRTGERAFFMTEQFRFHQRLGKRPAIDRDKRPMTAVAEVMNMPRYQLFAGAGLTDDQHTGFTRRDLLQMREQGLGFRVFEHLRGGADRRGERGGGR